MIERFKNWLSRSKRVDVAAGQRSSISSFASDSLFFRSAANGAESTDPYSQVSTVYACINRISDAVSRLPLQAVRGDEKKWTPTPGPWQTFFDSPNPLLIRDDFWAATIAYLYTQRGCKWILLGKTGLRQPNEIPTEAYPVPGSWLVGYAASGGIVRDWSQPVATWQASVTTSDGVVNTRNFLPHQVVDLKFFDPGDPINGFLPLDPCRNSINGVFAAETWNASFFVNNCDPGGWIKVTGNMPTAEQRKQFEDAWKSQHEGPERRGKTAFLYAGADFTPNPRGQKEMEFIAGLERNAEEICKVFGVPSTLLAPKGTTFSNVRDSIRIFYELTVLGLLSRFESHIYERIMRPIDQETWAKFDLSNVQALQSDYSERLGQAAQIVGLGWTPDEANERLSLGLPRATYLDEQEDATDAALSEVLPASPEVASVQDTALNGAQVTALQGVVQAVADGNLPAAAAKVMLPIAFPTIDKTEAATMIDSAAQFAKARPAEDPNGEAPRGIIALIKRGMIDVRSLSPRTRDKYIATLWRAQHPMEKKLDAVIRKYLRSLSAEQRRLFDEWAKNNGLGADAVAKLSQADIEAIIFQREKWDAAMREQTRPPIEKSVRSALEKAADETGSIAIPMQDPRISTLLGKTGATLVQTNGTTQRRIRAQLLAASANGETIAEMQGRISEAASFDAPRALLIARTETGFAANGARYDQFREADIERHEWANSGFGERPTHKTKSAANPTAVGGEVVDVGKPFSNGLTYPLEFGADVAEVANCRCVALGVV